MAADGIATGAAAGAATGAVAGPWGAAIGAVVGGVLGSQSKGGGGGGALPAPQIARQDATQTFDSSNWSVATGSGRATSKQGAPANIPWTMLAVAGVVALLIWKRS